MHGLLAGQLRPLLLYVQATENILFKPSGVCYLQVEICCHLYFWRCTIFSLKDQGTVEVHYYFISQLRKFVEELYVSSFPFLKLFIFPSEEEACESTKEDVTLSWAAVTREGSVPDTCYFHQRPTVWSGVWFMTPVDLERALVWLEWQKADNLRQLIAIRMVCLKEYSGSGLVLFSSHWGPENN